MKYLIFILTAISFLAIQSCDRLPNDCDCYQDITAEVTNFTDCKNDQTELFFDGYDKTTTAIEYTYDESTKSLMLRHINANFNCCPGKIYCGFEIDDNVIVVQELSEKEDCRCICLYDVDFLLNNVEKGIYTIAIKELYIEEALWLQFDIDLNESTSGVFKQTREFYPWGV